MNRIACGGRCRKKFCHLLWMDRQYGQKALEKRKRRQYFLPQKTKKRFGVGLNKKHIKELPLRKKCTFSGLEKSLK